MLKWKPPKQTNRMRIPSSEWLLGKAVAACRSTKVHLVPQARRSRVDAGARTPTSSPDAASFSPLSRDLIENAITDHIAADKGVLVHTHDYKRNGMTTLFAALNVL